jgi:hypothetical protein
MRRSLWDQGKLARSEGSPHHGWAVWGESYGFLLRGPKSGNCWQGGLPNLLWPPKETGGGSLSCLPSARSSLAGEASRGGSLRRCVSKPTRPQLLHPPITAPLDTCLRRSSLGVLLGMPSATPKNDKLISASVQWARKIEV